ncbi:MAG: efflux RND transporter periplasmic adaptor subunit [Pseudomonadota bacterium]
MRLISLSPILLFLAGCGGAEKTPDRPSPLITLEAVALHEFSDRYEAVGTAIANEQVTVTAPVTERITRLGFSDGDYVRSGQMLAVLAQGQETASLASAAARAREAEQQLARIAALRERGFATKSSLDAQMASVAATRAGASEARAVVADRVIRAPFSGYVSLRRISVGAVVSAGTEIATISDSSTIKLDFSVPETLLGTVRVGQPILARAAAFPETPVGGTISAIDPVVDPATRAVIVRALIPNRGGRLKPGMLLSVALQSRVRSALAVPELALVREGDGRYVYTVDKDGKAKRVSVSTGGKDGNRIEVTQGLIPGDKIVTEGVVKLSEGAKVRVVGDKPPGKAAAAR